MGDFHLLFDYYPFKSSSFHLTAGAYIGKSELVTIQNKAPFVKQNYWGNAGIELGTAESIYTQYTIYSDNQGNVKADVKTNSFKPYVGIGFGRAIPKGRIGIQFDLGVQFWGTPEVWTNLKSFDYNTGDYIMDYMEPSIFRKLSVWNNVMAILETLKMKRADRAARCEELLTSLDLLKVAKQPAYTLSGGERRKLEIARALVRRPSILMLDEPFAGVDPLAVHDIQEIVRGLRTQGLGIIITDHNVRETLNVVDRAYLVYDGRLLCEGTSEYLVNDEDARRLYLGEDFRM